MPPSAPLGAGVQPAGTSAAGLGAPGGSGPATPLGLIAVWALAPAEGDYAVGDDDAGRPFAAITATEQRVVLALTTVPGSVAADPSFGNAALLLKKDDGFLARNVDDGCRRAVAFLVTEGAITFDGATLAARPVANLDFTANWTDLVRGSARATRVKR